jgi:hypothetical protein
MGQNKHHHLVHSRRSRKDTEGRAPHPAPAAPSPVASTLLALKPVDQWLTPKDAESLAAGLVKEVGEDGAMRAIDCLDEKQLAIASNPNKKNRAEYLRTCILNSFRGSLVDNCYTPEFFEGFRSGEIWMMAFRDTTSDAHVAYCPRLIHELADAEFFISEVRVDERHEGEKRFVEIRPRTQ